MTFFEKLLRLMDTQMQTPVPYGWFHLLFFIFSVAVTIWICLRRKKDSPERVRRVVLITSIIVILLEIYKQINFSLSYENHTIAFDYAWYAFPWQFCSTPMYIGLLVGITKKGKLHECACAYLATYAVFAGLSVMLYPISVFIGTIGVNIQTMICHGAMLPIGAYLFASGHVKTEHKTLLKALPVFIAVVLIAVISNEIAYQTNLLETDNFNMFYISPYCEPHLPVYSWVQEIVPFPWCLMVYVLGFTTAAYIILLCAICIHRIAGACSRRSAEKITV